MRSMLRYALFFAPFAATAACTGIVGDFNLGNGPPPSDGGTDTTLRDGPPPPTDGNGTGDTSPVGDGPGPTDGGSTDAKDAGVQCGYPGEACCAPPFAPCNAGTACVANKCRVNDLWAVGTFPVGFSNGGASMHYDGTSWSAGPGVPLTTSPSQSNPWPSSLWGTAPGQYKLVTTGGFVVEYQAGGGGVSDLWRECSATGAPCSYPNTQAELWGIYGFNFDDFWVGGSNVMFHCSTQSCVSTTTGLPASWGQGTFTGTSSSDLWYPQFDHAFHYDGAKWTTTSGIQARAMWAHSATDVWAGDVTLQHFDGQAWSQPYILALPDAGGMHVFAMSGTATDDVWAVGYTNTSSGANIPFAARWNGQTWTLVNVPSAAGQVSVVWAAARDEAYLGGGTGVYKWDGTAWTAMTLPPASDWPDASFGASPGWDFIYGSARPRP